MSMTSGEQLYSARNLGRVAGNTWELRVAEQPKLVTDLVRVPLQDGVYLLGGTPQTLAGSSVEWLWTSLGPLLDGSRTHAELLAAIGDISAEELGDVLHFLQMHGLLEEGRSALPAARRADADARFGPQLAFFSRYLSLTGYRRNRHEAQAALDGACVGLYGDPGCLAIVRELLARAGIGALRELDAASAERCDGVDLVVAVAPQRELELVTRRLASAKLPCLYADPERLEIGPLTLWGCSPCPTCVRLQSSASSEPAPEPALAVRALWRRALAARVAAHVVMYASGIVPPIALEHIESWQPARGASSFRLSVPRLPSCPTCGRAGGPEDLVLPSGHRDNRARMFHAAATLQPWHVRQPAGMQGHLAPGVVELQRRAALEHAGAPRRELARVESSFDQPARAALQRQAPAPMPLDPARLGALLRLSFGGDAQRVEGGGRRFVRHTASAGNLGSAEAFLAVRELPGFASGAYHYMLQGGVLEALDARAPLPALARCVEDPSARAAILGADVVIAIVSAIERVCQKYQARGYTYALLDAGLMAHRVELLARAAGLEAAPIRHFSDVGVAAVFGLDGIDLAPTLLVAVKGVQA